MRWEFSTLKELILNRYGEENATSFIEAAQSIAWKLNMHNYHASESLRVLKEAIFNSEAISPDTNESVAAVKAIFLSGMGDKRAPPLNIARFEAEAHMIAAAQSLHSSADIISCTIYWAFDFTHQKGSPKIEHLNLRNISKYLTNIPLFIEMDNAIKSFLKLPEFMYLSAFVNTTKHHSLVEIQYMANFDQTEGPPQGIRIKPFQYKDYSGTTLSFDKKWGSTFLFKDGLIIIEGLLNIGNEISNYYSSQK